MAGSRAALAARDIPDDLADAHRPILARPSFAAVDAPAPAAGIDALPDLRRKKTEKLVGVPLRLTPTQISLLKKLCENQPFTPSELARSIIAKGLEELSKER